MTLEEKAAWLAEHLLEWTWDEDPEGGLDFWYDDNKAKSQGDNALAALSTGNGALEIIEAMRERKYSFKCESALEDDHFFVNFFFSAAFWVGVGETLPAAVIDAAYTALQESTGDSAKKSSENP